MIPSHIIIDQEYVGYLSTHEFDWQNSIITPSTSYDPYKDYKCIHCGIILIETKSGIVKYGVDGDLAELTCNEVIMSEIME